VEVAAAVAQETLQPVSGSSELGRKWLDDYRARRETEVEAAKSMLPGRVARIAENHFSASDDLLVVIAQRPGCATRE
jgi:hypothetical protein